MALTTVGLLITAYSCACFSENVNTLSATAGVCEKSGITIITNTAVIVVRYFGGTLLGVPGLINAYKTATTLALQVVPVIQKQIEIKYSIEFDYTQMNEVMKIVKQFNCMVLKQDMQLFCLMEIGAPKNRLDEVMNKLKELRGVEVKKI